jgi:hypothetical protein
MTIYKVKVKGKTYEYDHARYIEKRKEVDKRARKQFFGVHEEVINIVKRNCLYCGTEFDSENGVFRLCTEHRIVDTGQLYGGATF